MDRLVGQRIALTPGEVDDVPRVLLSREQVVGHLARERARTDRTGRQFSLVVFRTQTADEGDLTPARVALTVVRRVRATDYAGRFGHDAVCAILPETDAEGAGQFAAQVRNLLGDGEATAGLSCDIYTYPSHWLETRNGNGSLTSELRTGARAVTVVDTWTRLQPLGLTEANEPPQPVVTETRPMESLFARPLPPWKRAVDVCCAAASLVVLSPVMAAVAVVVKLSSPGPVLFRQRRAGLGHRPFVMYKFRTMVDGAERKQAELRGASEQDGPAFKMTHDPRVTPLGRFLRKSSLDELPQLWNVLKGDMSLVGPRPLPLHETRACQPWHHRRLDVTPGITCVWQIRGRCGVGFADWMRMDIRYARGRSLRGDLRLLLQTIPAVVRCRGAR